MPDAKKEKIIKMKIPEFAVEIARRRKTEKGFIQQRTIEDALNFAMSKQNLKNWY